MSADSTIIRQTYGIQRWGEGYFGIDPNGRVMARPDPDRAASIDLFRLAQEVREAGLAWPVLVRFTDILHHRVRNLCRAFAEVAGEVGYRGGYTAVYPIKVNQQRSVVEELVAGGGDCVGLEAGSKPELMAVLALGRPGSVIVCNGYKDREFVRLALIGRALGHRIYIVIEKPGELELVLQQSAELGVVPLLGVRVRLAAVASGNWQNSGGEKSKFGLSSAQLLELVERLRALGRLDCLQLLHSHIGSQIPNLRHIRDGIGEVARYYAELRRLGAPVSVVDAGGGLGVDYEGTGTRHYCSINYSLEGYAGEVIRGLLRVCEDQDLPHPQIFTESGRAMTAHHAVLITNVIEREAAPGLDATGAEVEELLESESAHEAIDRMRAELLALDRRSPLEVFQEARHIFDETRELFAHGEMSLEDRACAERLFYAVARRVRQRLNPASRRQHQLLETLNELLADRVFCNFSLFQSLPDVWAIDQIFPVLPLQRLNETPDASVMLHDLTCDSDGCIEQYVDQDGVEATLPMHIPRPGEPYLLGIFLAGAYQEILGDMHNLFGDTDAVNVELDPDGGYRLTQAEQGDAVDELLRYVHFDPDEMLASYRRKLDAAALDAARVEAYYRELEEGLRGYTYLED